MFGGKGQIFESVPSSLSVYHPVHLLGCYTKLRAALSDSSEIPFFAQISAWLILYHFRGYGTDVVSYHTLTVWCRAGLLEGFIAALLRLCSRRMQEYFINHELFNETRLNHPV